MSSNFFLNIEYLTSANHGCPEGTLVDKLSLGLGITGLSPKTLKDSPDFTPDPEASPLHFSQLALSITFLLPNAVAEVDPPPSPLPLSGKNLSLIA